MSKFNDHLGVDIIFRRYSERQTFAMCMVTVRVV